MKYINGNELNGKRFIELENGDLRELTRKKYMPKEGETYYYISLDNKVSNTIYEDDISDVITMHSSNRYCNPVFRTIEECKEYEHYLEMLDQYTVNPSWKDDYPNWCLSYNHEKKKIIYSFFRTEQFSKYYFLSKEDVEKFINEVGEDAIKRFMFDIWD